MKRHKIILVLILLFAVVTRLWNLAYPKGYYFDEVYNAFTTQEFVKNNKDAYEWFHQSPVEGTAYGWTHPPLAKLMGAVGILFFGDNEFGWRIINSLVGVGIVYLVYVLGKNLLKNETTGLVAAALASLDGLLLVQSRINMNDIVATFFVLVVFLAFYNYQSHKNSPNLLWLGVSLGLLVATKWTGLYAILVLGIWIGWQNLTKFNKWPQIFVALLVIPAAIYLLSYSQYFLLGGTWNNFIELQKQMWWYNTRLTATHTYQSLWWTWPLDIRPVWYFVDYSQPGQIANIYALGNPILWWLGIGGLVFTLRETVKKKSWQLGLIILGYLTFWLPWARAPRIMFIYHYLPSVPFMCLALAYSLQRLDKKYNYLSFAVLAAIGLTFLFFFPHWTAIHVSSNFDKYFFWFNSWK